MATVSEPEYVDGSYRCAVAFKDFPKTTKIVGIPTTNQYADENKAEEDYHVLQWMGDVTSSEGGQSDCYTAKGIIYYLKKAGAISGNGPWYVTGSTAKDARDNAWALVSQGRDLEATQSKTTTDLDLGFREVTAKKHAGYNAAWKYHCTYEATYGLEASQTDHVHPAYQ